MNARRMTWKEIEPDDYFQARSKPRKTIIELIQDEGSMANVEAATEAHVCVVRMPLT